MKTALYARISTRDGRQFAENQIERMRSYASRQGWTIVREYVDHGTGAKGIEGRDQLAELMQDAYLGKFEMVLVFALDRFTREGVLKAFQYIERLAASSVGFRSVTEEHFQTSGPAGELFMAVSAWMAKQERTQLRNRINAGLDRARAAGKILGRPSSGLDLTQLERLRNEGKSLRQIADVMKKSKSTIERGLKRIRKLKVVELPKLG